LRGYEKGSVDRAREGRGGAIEPSAALVNYGKRTMTDAEARLDLDESFLVLSAIRKTCAFRHWTLLAAHIRSTHAHLVVDGSMEAWKHGSKLRDPRFQGVRQPSAERLRICSAPSE
jgi:hypothetical protein